MTERVVYKYPVESGGEFGPVLMPVAAEILHADTIVGTVYVWALVDTDAPSTVVRHLGFFGTGHKEIPAGARHIGTCIDPAYDLVWHVFEEANRG